MIEISITPSMIAEAQRKSDEMGRLNNSIRKGKGNLTGFLGEEAFAHHFGVESSNTYDYDFILPDGTKVDVKTKKRTVSVRGDYNATVADFNTSQDCDRYYFVSLIWDKKTQNWSKAQLCGSISKERFYADATFAKKGDPDGRWDFKADCYNLRYDCLDGWHS